MGHSPGALRAGWDSGTWRSRLRAASSPAAATVAHLNATHTTLRLGSWGSLSGRCCYRALTCIALGGRVLSTYASAVLLMAEWCPLCRSPSLTTAGSLCTLHSMSPPPIIIQAHFPGPSLLETSNHPQPFCDQPAHQPAHHPASDRLAAMIRRAP